MSFGQFMRFTLTTSKKPNMLLRYASTMTPEQRLYGPYEVIGTNFSAMLECGPPHNFWVEVALNYLPQDVFDEHEKMFVFIAMANKDACRVARHYCETREVIVLSERILPSENDQRENSLKVRYFIFAVLHEVAHAIKNHKSPKLESLTEEEYKAQELEADELAMSWFNDYVAKRNNESLPITDNEIKTAQEANNKLFARLLTDE